ncbi:hypothetical protein [Amycolatopsis pithecellobii]|uniref:hypothetical protein n=1 Tax=Amycolatopsis pithecellobii TaxID=664692 RepID=UPI0012B95185|nr:hypothetical protein [Amycolatopsis pithecellobii]
MGALFGARIFGVHVPWFGDGYGDFAYGDSTGSLPRVLALATGPLSHVIGGAIALVIANFVRRWPAGLFFRTVFTIYGAINVLAGLQYLASGSYYGYGDPTDALIVLVPPCSTGALQWVSIVVTVIVEAAILAAAYWIPRKYLALQDSWFPARNLSRRLIIFAMTAVPAIVVFVGGFVLSGEQSPTFYAGTESAWNKPVIAQQIDHYADGYRAENPQATPAQVCRVAANRYANQLISGREEEQRKSIAELRAAGRGPAPGRTVPLLYISAVILCVGSGAAALRTREGR